MRGVQRSTLRALPGPETSCVNCFQQAQASSMPLAMTSPGFHAGLAAAADEAAAPAEGGQMASAAEAGDPAAAAADEADAAAEHLVIEEPQGLLPARAYKTLRLTLTPRRRHRYSLQLQCRTATAVDGSHTGELQCSASGSLKRRQACCPMGANLFCVDIVSLYSCVHQTEAKS